MPPSLRISRLSLPNRHWGLTERLKQDLEARHDALLQFVRASSHELRRPVTASLQVLDWIEADLDKLSRRDLIALLGRVGDRLRQLSKVQVELAHYVQTTPMDVETTDINLAALVEDTWELLQPLDGSASSTSMHLDGNFPSLRTARAPLRQVLLQVLGYASRSEPPTSTVTIRADAGLHHVVFTIRDDGPSIPRTLQERLFEPWRKAPGRPGQSALGLPMIRRILQRLRCDIAVEDTPDGNQWTFTWPRHWPRR